MIEMWRNKRWRKRWTKKTDKKVTIMIQWRLLYFKNTVHCWYIAKQLELLFAYGDHGSWPGVAIDPTSERQVLLQRGWTERDSYPVKGRVEDGATSGGEVEWISLSGWGVVCPGCTGGGVTELHWGWSVSKPWWQLHWCLVLHSDGGLKVSEPWGGGGGLRYPVYCPLPAPDYFLPCTTGPKATYQPDSSGESDLLLVQ